MRAEGREKSEEPPMVVGGFDDEGVVFTKNTKEPFESQVPKVNKRYKLFVHLLR